MSSKGLTPTSYLVLALVGRGGAGPHDIASMLQRSPLYWHAAPSRYYSEPKRLEKLGYLKSHKEPGKTTERTVYRLTSQGLSELRAWLSEPARFPRVQNEAAMRLLAGDLLDDETIVASLRGMAPEMEALEEQLAETEKITAAIPHRARYLELSHRLPKKLLAAYREWIDEVAAELGEGDSTDEKPKRRKP